MRRLSHLAPEEIAGAIILAMLLTFLALRPGAITRSFESPYATPAPGGGPGVQFLREPAPTPIPSIGAAPLSSIRAVLRTTPRNADEATTWLVWYDSEGALDFVKGVRQRSIPLPETTRRARYLPVSIPQASGVTGGGPGSMKLR